MKLKGKTLASIFVRGSSCEREPEDAKNRQDSNISLQHIPHRYESIACEPSSLTLNPPILHSPLHHLLAVDWLVGQQAPDLAWKNE